MNNESRDKLTIKIDSRGLFVIYTIITICVYTLPYTKLTIPYIIAGLMMLVTIPIIAIKNTKWLNYTALLVIASAILMLFCMISEYFTLTDSINEMIRNIRFFTPALWTMYVLQFCSKNQKKVIIVLFGVLVCYILYKTMNALANDQWITRILAQSATTDSAEIRSYRLGNVGGFEFSYMIGIVTLCLVWAALKCKKIIVKILSILAAIFCFYYIIQTMYTTLLLLTSLGILALLFMNIKNILGKVVLIIGFLALIFVLPTLFDYLSNLFSGSLLSTKFLQMESAITGGGAEELGSRPEYMMEAFRGWLHSPIWGGYSYTLKVHSFLVGLLESHGIIGIALWFALYKSTYKMISSNLKQQGVSTELFNIVAWFILLLSFFNPIGYCFELTIAGFFITPIWIMIVNNSIGNAVSES